MSSRDALANFIPTFTDNLNFTNAVKIVCYNVLSCMIDATLTGINDIGKVSAINVQTQQKDNEVLCKLQFKTQIIIIFQLCILKNKSFCTTNYTICQ